MANRPVFVPKTIGAEFVEILNIDFQWHPGFSVSQAQKSIRSLHNSAENEGVYPVLEISTRSPEPLGVSLSAFNLQSNLLDRGRFCVEVIFQASKVFENGGPYTDILDFKPSAAKRDPRLQASGDLVAFELSGEEWPLEPTTAFYDWVYLKALTENQSLADKVIKYAGFTDIAFNPKRSFNCQARSAALFASFHKRGILKEALSGKQRYMALLTAPLPTKPVQCKFPGFT